MSLNCLASKQKPLTKLIDARLIPRLITQLCTACLLATGVAQADGNRQLADIHESIQHEFATIEHVDASRLEAMADRDLLVFDVRRQDEFDVSHLAGAVRVAADVSVDEFMASYSHLARGKSLVFYCSVGQRSSALASRLREPLLIAGASEVYNLEGGIFRWHNDGRALVNASQDSTYIHPYNAYWGRLIDRSELIRYRPVD